ncbi:MAG: acyl-CoA dehydrogenase, partial [Chloroflexi bacterium]|nr:acyl-CoA dehydrogenase [Chloroflexota bacterium]
AGAVARVERDAQLAAIATRLRPLADVGADHQHVLLRTTLRQFADKEVRPHAERIHRDDADIPDAVIAGVAALGLLGISIPEAYGGFQAEPDSRAMLVATEELSSASLGAAGSLMTRPEILVRALLRAGTEGQKKRWLPGVADGGLLVAVSVTEPDQGSDVAALRCRAVRTAGGWVINGTKLWCTFAGRADLITILCRTSEDGHRGLSLFVAQKPRFLGREFEHRQTDGGALRGRAIPTIGYRGMHTFELAFTDYLLPEDSLVGGDAWIGKGFQLQLEGFAMGRLQTAGRAVGVMDAALAETLAYTSARRVFGRTVREWPLAQAKLGAMALAIEGSRRLAYAAGDAIDRGAPDAEVQAALAKLYASRMAEQVTRDAAQLHGAMGYAEETDVSRYFVDARVLPVFEGAEEVLSLRVIGKALLAGSR